MNFGHHSPVGLKADALFVQTKAKYPDLTDPFASSVAYKGSELRVPVQLVIQGGEGGAAYMGFGGYYGHRFKASLPAGWTVRTDDYGLAAEFGLKVGGIGISTVWMSSLAPLFVENGAPSVRQVTGLFRISKYF